MWLSPDPGEAKGISLPHLEHAGEFEARVERALDEMAWSAELPRIVRVDSRATDVLKRPLASS